MSSRDEGKATPTGSDGGSSYDDVGAGVSAILKAAEDAAENIRAEARRHAANLIHEAEEAVAARLQGLTREAEQLRTDAEAEARDMRLAVEAYGTKRRRDADEEADRLLADAERRAREIVDGAETRVREANEALAQRTESLRAELRSLEVKRTKAADALRRIVAHLEDALEGESPSRDGDEQPTRIATRRLDEDLRPETQRRRRLSR